MKNVVKIYYKYQEVINYLIIGLFTTFVSLITYYISVSTLLDPNNAIELQLANVFSWICSVIFAYLTNRIFVFKSTNKSKIKEFISFVFSRIATLLLDMTIMFLLVTCLQINDKLSKLIVQVIVIVLNYVLSKCFVFKKIKE